MREATARSARIDFLVTYVLEGVTLPAAAKLDDEIGAWLSASSQFSTFVDAHRDKIRKKLRVASDPDAMDDMRAELKAAFLLLTDRRIDVAFEAYGSGRRGPDFTVTFRASHQFNLEVTRPRARGDEAERDSAIAHAVLGKLRQLPVDAPNALLVATGLARSDDEVRATMHALKVRADRHQDELFNGRGLSIKEFQTFYRRLAAVMVASDRGPGVFTWTNPEARRPLPAGALAACRACLARGDARV
jgi:hypothetical protein